MNSYAGDCLFCGKPVGTAFAAYPITGYEITRRGGGANRILGRERVPEQVAHIHCAQQAVERKRRGIAEEQGALL